MEKVVIPADLSARIRGLAGPSFLADEAGNTVAYVLPPEAFHRLTADVEPTPEERDAARDEYRRVGGLTTAEAVAFVRAGGAG